MPPAQIISSRRSFLRQTSAACAYVSTPVFSQSGRSSPAQHQLTVAQLVDVSQAQQDVSKDFLIGSRAAW